ncbi:superfamily II DNA/RNA helicase [Clostridium tetanomorphum]|uniref:DEAD/DEAH box helicase n=1 Tax=Clostridium tetanomorphum TaxID=1553 RepID=A0A923E9Z9_CLOTT|nr:DEAD/DEAH box helicase [Clostridium tetanomorphum]KAJ51038.1 ATP-dependent RNA helicase [Clostridium tetanomorphum DSM 665]MBC2399347.1 DEAD/DEAH box helicase [Clostridium tetanomorphum]MBP1865862.1 superfamily II DNA/RNA helicase [Clostridium tetanomorphum]NRS85311.1 superfamily II DNA/RNA helicase [Clostridium tetanomorphum]NRZ98490.1 superfamily II DNA/RNA helicase [Clostridium tetanomorphum]
MENLFDKLGLNLQLIEGLKKEGIEKPTPIQIRAIPLALENKDIIGKSETGSGKTLAYLLPLFQKINTDKKEMQAIILAPTHELVMQIHNEIKLLSKNSGVPVTSCPIIGEVNIKRQIEKLKEKPHIIVGSTGRIFELIKLKKISAHTIKTIVIDEGDRLLDMNNITNVKNVIKTTLRERQLMIFSATINEKTINIAKDFMKNAKILQIEDNDMLNPNINHIYFICEQRDKIETLRKLFAALKLERAIVFLNKKDEIEITTAKLQYHHIKAYAIYGNASKEDRKKAIEGFRNGKIKLLIASDIAARGLDIKGVTHIINLDLPEDPKEYLHRVGRTGRAGKSGTAVSIVTKKELSLIKKYEKELNIKIEEKLIYNGIIHNL